MGPDVRVAELAAGLVIEVGSEAEEKPLVGLPIGGAVMNLVA
jgi:hypothetical protein